MTYLERAGHPALADYYPAPYAEHFLVAGS